MYQISMVRWQENSSFANFGIVSAGAVCKCAVLCVGCFRFFYLFAANYPLCLGFSPLVPNGRRHVPEGIVKLRLYPT
jgi:hypothetical protein